MIVQIEVQPDTAALIQQAKSKGVSLDIVLRDALEQVQGKNGNSAQSAISLEELEASLDALSEDSENAPVLPDEANSRAFYYEERIP